MRNDLCLAGTIVPYRNQPLLNTQQTNGYKSQELIAVPRHLLQPTFSDLSASANVRSQIRLAERPSGHMPEIRASQGLPINVAQIAELNSQSLPSVSSYGGAYAPARALPYATANEVDWDEVESFVSSSGIKQYAQENVMPFVRRRLDEEGISSNQAFIAAGNAIVANKDPIIEKIKQNHYVTQAVVDVKRVMSLEH